MKFLRSILFVAIAMVLLAGCSSESSSSGDSEGKVYKIKLSHSSPATNDRLETSLQEFKKNVEERSNGAIKIETYPASQLGGEREQLEGVQMGSIEMAALSSGPFPGFYKQIMVFDLPYIFKNREIAYEVLDGPFGQKILDNMLKETGIRGLAWGENGFRNFTNNVRPIKTPEDLKGLKIRTMENPAHMAMVEALGADPNPMAFSEVYSALQQGVIDGQENPISLIQSMRFYEVNKYLTLDGHVYNPFVLIINENFFKSLPEELQTILEEEAQKWSDLQRELNYKQSTEGVEFLKEQGMEVVELTDEEKIPFQEATKSVIDQYRSELGDELIDELMKAIEEAEKKVE